uniref:Biotin-protein ligase N-terminal domain-containing protein n=1 Tax=Odontella aurita TaxID=265563 RepID=A0A7S4NDA2_9STRA|mmetsp:Transcript_59169/g.175856  ORF Transcript_59169/g.175856 Transcript_59169/m.175856 type:complete len:366 (+) Transcript_59169:227-1324(+)|eukprot:CAMPEP_0113549372 /NCGR_PEP_ID=MMETSP0015_2-20120614/13398_1 /TAXON_ID=2838 /ORGANISM="Odontella" /LENGTH=365 /DNA_ID=CAMNT_0000450077 /DNA_START=112 /DNA_END=1209 /DNA_ORIENTATION=+ /assembly_acc=CAM_ASM_000160
MSAESASCAKKASAERTVVVGVFAPPPRKRVVCDTCVRCIEDIVERQPQWRAIRVTPEEMEMSLPDCDVFIIPGGYSHKIARLLGEGELRDCLVEWRTKRRGGFVGICAGAVVACSGGKDGCGLVEGIQVIRGSHFNVSNLEGMVSLSETPDAPDAFHCMDGAGVPYFNGPLLTKTVSEKEDVKVWARYSSDLFMEMGSHEIPYEHLVAQAHREYMLSWKEDEDDREESNSPPVDNDSPLGGKMRREERKLRRRAQEAAKQSAVKKREDGAHGDGWICSRCGALHRRTDQRCCGKKKNYHVKQRHISCKPEGRVMEGTAAVVASEIKEDGRGRSVLFGPHPELSGGHGAVESLLVDAIKYVAYLA